MTSADEMMPTAADPATPDGFMPSSSASTVDSGTRHNDPLGNDGQIHAQPPSEPLKLEEPNERRQPHQQAGRRLRARTERKRGRAVSSRIQTPVTDLALDATLRAAAPFQAERARVAPPSHRRSKIILHRSDLRQKVRIGRTRAAICFAVDASWSMAAEERMRTAKRAVLALLKDAYQQRDRVGLVSFHRAHARVLLPLTTSVEQARQSLQHMPTGGKTPLSHGLLASFTLLHRARLRDPELVPMLVIITDAQANVSLGSMAPQDEAYRMAEYISANNIRALVIDTEHPQYDRGHARELARRLGGTYCRLEDLDAFGIVRLVRSELAA